MTGILDRMPATQSLYGSLGPALERVAERYAEPHRAYHGRRHLDELLSRLAEWGAEPAEVLELFVLFHDAVYDPGAKDNETRSADLASSVLRDLPASTVAAVTRAILGTVDHLGEDADETTRVAIDLDLSPLADADAHPGNVRLIRQEYAMFDDDAFRQGRVGFVESFLKRPRIFWSAFGEPLEAAARRNLETELKAWQAEKPRYP